MTPTRSFALVTALLLGLFTGPALARPSAEPGDGRAGPCAPRDRKDQAPPAPKTPTPRLPSIEPSLPPRCER